MKSETTTTAKHQVEATTHDVHVKRVPHDAWCHGRHNALLSGLSFKDYLIRLLRGSTPVRTVGAGTSNTQAAPAQTKPADGTGKASTPVSPQEADHDQYCHGTGAGPPDQADQATSCQGTNPPQ